MAARKAGELHNKQVKDYIRDFMVQMTNSEKVCVLQFYNSYVSVHSELGNFVTLQRTNGTLFVSLFPATYTREDDSVQEEFLTDSDTDSWAYRKTKGVFVILEFSLSDQRAVMCTGELCEADFNPEKRFICSCQLQCSSNE